METASAGSPPLAGRSRREGPSTWGNAVSNPPETYPLVEIDCYINLTFRSSTLARMRWSVKQWQALGLFHPMTETIG